MAANKKTPGADGSGPPPLDRRAVRALFGTYWTAGGWRDMTGNKSKTPPPPAAEVEYARSAGYMFGPRPMTHDEVVAWLLQVRETVTRGEVTDAFVASLGSRRLDWRSALGSFAVARHFPDHRHPGGAKRSCGTCGSSGGADDNQTEDLSLLNFERLKWGGVRHLHPEYAAFDLELFARAEKPSPRAEDLAILKRILDTARGMAPNARLDHLQRAMGEHLSSSKNERCVLIQILGYCGILQDPAHPGFREAFPPATARYGGPSGDWTYPVEFWRGRHGVNEEAVAFWFGDY